MRRVETVRGGIAELGDDIGVRCEGARRIALFVQTRAVFQIDLDAHGMSEAGASGRDSGFVLDIDFLGQGDAARVVQDGFSEPIDEDLVLQRQRRHAVAQMQLRRGRAIRHVFPAATIDRGMRAMHHDTIDIVGADGVPAIPRE
jgi:hypothetical protein